MECGNVIEWGSVIECGSVNELGSVIVLGSVIECWSVIECGIMYIWCGNVWSLEVYEVGKCLEYRAELA